MTSETFTVSLWMAANRRLDPPSRSIRPTRACRCPEVWPGIARIYAVSKPTVSASAGLQGDMRLFGQPAAQPQGDRTRMATNAGVGDPAGDGHPPYCWWQNLSANNLSTPPNFVPLSRNFSFARG